MVLESTMVCIDNSDFMRNGDFVPTRLQAQQDAVNLVCHSKTRSNPENNLGLLTLSNTEVLATLTADTGRILSKLHQVQPKGSISFVSGVRIAHLALKHRQGKNHKMRIVIFVGSPIEDDEKELVKQAKRLKKEKVSVDVVNFGEEAVNTDKLTAFVNTINGKDGTGSHLVTVPPGPLLSDALVSSPVIVGEDGTGAVPAGTGFEFGVDPNEDPELALALRVSMEEQRARQEEDARRVVTESAAEQPAMATDDTKEEALLKRAMEMSLKPEGTTTSAATDTAQSTPSVPDISMLSEEEQIALAMQMSLDPTEEGEETPMETEGEAATGGGEDAQDDDYSEVINDPAFLQSVLEGLPGVDPSSDAIRTAMSQLTKQPDKDSKDKNDKPKDGKQ